MAKNKLTASHSEGRSNNAVRGVNMSRDRREGRVHDDVCDVKEQSHRYEQHASLLRKEVNYQHDLIDCLTDRISALLTPDSADPNVSKEFEATSGEPTVLAQTYASLVQEAQIANARLETLINRIYI